jgi:ribonucleotide reductase alpha subunit
MIIGSWQGREHRVYVVVLFGCCCGYVQDVEMISLVGHSFHIDGITVYCRLSLLVQY